MESALVSIMMMTVALFAVLTLGNTYLTTQDVLLAADMDRQTRLLDRAETDLAVVSAIVKSGGAVIEVTLRNTGESNAAEFAQWDMFVEYEGDAGEYRVERIPYATILTQNSWTVAGIYQQSAGMSGEAYDFGILNPGEEMVLHIQVYPNVGEDAVNRAVIATPNGKTVSTFFTR